MLLKQFSFQNYSIEIYDSIDDELCSANWKQCDQDFTNGKYLKLIEQIKPSDLSFKYVVVKNKHNQYCANIYFQKLKFTGQNIHLKNKLLSTFSHLLLFIRPFKILICGNVFAVNFPPYTYNSSLISTKELFGIINAICATEKADGIMIKDVQESEAENDLKQNGFQNYSSDLTMSLKLKPSWILFSDYINDLTKKYRRRAEKIIKSAEGVVRKELTLTEIQFYKMELFQLFKNVSIKQTICMGLINEDYFEKFKHSYPNEFRIIGYFLNDQLIAFSSFIDHKAQLEVHYIGMNYALNSQFNLYFNILFDSLRLAIEEKKSELELGRTAREAKANLGSEPVYFNDFFKLNGKLTKMAMNWLGSNFQRSMGDDWRKRNPFK